MQIQKLQTPYNPDTEISCWSSDNPTALVHIFHGMGEHKNRYDHFAQFLSSHGISVYAHDHPGHGSHLNSFAKQGHFGDSLGFDNVLSTAEAVQKHIRNQHPKLPSFILGHSMGSFIAQHYLMTYGTANNNGLILSGSAHTPPLS